MKEPNNLIYLRPFRLSRTCCKAAFSYQCADADLMTKTIKTEPLRQTFSYLSEWNVSWIPPSFTDPASIFVSFPSPRLPSLPLSLCIFSLFFFHCEQLTAVSLKSLHVSWVVLSYPACTAAIWSSVGSGWAHTFDVGRGEGGGQADAMMLLYILLSMVSLSAHCCHQFEKGFFPPPLFAIFFHSGPEIVSMRLKKKGKKNSV